MLLFTNSQLCHFTNQAQGDRGDLKHEFHQGVDSLYLFCHKYQMHRVFKEIEYLYQFLK